MADEAGIVERTAGGDGPLTPEAAARSLIDTRRKDDGEAQETATPEETPESPAQADDASPEEVPSETQVEDGADTQPPVDPPRSWSKEDKELWTGLPRETQERLAERERSRERDFLTRQQEAAEKLKSLTAKEQQAEQVRQQFEATLPQLQAAIQQAHAGEFQDIQSQADVERLAREDWPRYIMWDASQKKVAAVQREVQLAEQRQATEKTTKWNDFTAKEDALFVEKAPEMADQKKAQSVATSAQEMLKELGFTQKELSDLWNGSEKLSLRDHRFQLIIRDATRYRDAKALKPAPKPVPQVQRPGVVPSRGERQDDRVKALTARLDQTGKVEDAVQALIAQRAARR